MLTTLLVGLFCVLFSAIHSKDLVAILHLLVALATHYSAPICLPEKVALKVILLRSLEPSFSMKSSEINFRYVKTNTDQNLFLLEKANKII